MIEQNLFPKTSLPPVQDYIEAFTPALEAGKDIICFTITDTLSGSFQSATTAKQMLEENYPQRKIYIENSWSATGSQYLIVREAGVCSKLDMILMQYIIIFKKQKQIVVSFYGWEH